MIESPDIAVVDDDLAMREAMEGLLRSCGYRTKLFVSAEDFLCRYKMEKIDCMFLDVKMTGMSGVELQAELNSRGSRLPIIFVTSHVDERTRSAAMEGGAHDFLGKPVDDEVLLKSLKSALAET